MALGGDLLWLLSDAPEPYLVSVRGLGQLGVTSEGGPDALRLGRRVPLLTRAGLPFPQALDGEGLVITGSDIWIVSEGRRTAERPAQLLRFDRRSGRLREEFALPEDWRPAPGRGLAANKGPESLTLLPGEGLSSTAGPFLLLAAEQPLLQDPPGQVRLLTFGPLAAATRPAASLSPMGSLQLSLEGPEWGLTELMALPQRGGLLGLIRGYAPPNQWWARLVLLPQPVAAERGSGSAALPSLEPLQQWDLLAEGLSPDNWEGLAPGPPLADGRPTLLLVSDDNFNPLQASRIARLAPRRLGTCPRPLSPASRGWAPGPWRPLDPAP